MRARDSPLQRTMSLATLKATLSAVPYRAFVHDAVAALISKQERLNFTEYQRYQVT